ncbi:YdiU family protein [Limnobacter humi]|uniref:Protein nucleotidyltransferase YdiU n=1 Tax=Limnobacter humi TaxID=1778671 RepID=A0ABT1WHN3_9BURK|nr:YdiU family protein [Limnobacter humi]MCQ8895944.1 YdiU family protein [Limnobacter humi]
MLHSTDSVLVQEYASLGQPFLTAVPTTPLKTPVHWVSVNQALAGRIGIDPLGLQSSHGLDVCSGNAPWPGYPSMASVYCGHQFGVFVPQLGDGRALLIAEIRKGRQYHQLQLKGAGPTPYSRHADGRAVLRSSIREYLCSEAMHHLGVPSTRALSLTASSDPVFRETTETAAIVCRVSPSFLRFGHIEYFCYSNQHERLRELVAWHMDQQHPEIDQGNSDEAFSHAVLQWLTVVIHRTAVLMAKWQAVGFCHGVMNTDNMSLLGLTIDYGPFGFMDGLDVDHVCNHSDQHGRYSYRNQPRIGHWNLYALAQALTPLIRADKDQIQAVLDDYAAVFHQHHNTSFAIKTGLLSPETPAQPSTPVIDNAVESTLQFMHQHQLDFTRFFRSLSVLNPMASVDENFAAWQSSAHFPLALGDEAQIDQAKAWLGNWQQWFESIHGRAMLDLPVWRAGLNQVNPAWVLRNHLLQQAIDTAQHGDFTEVNRLAAALSHPFDEQHPASDMAAPPEWARGLVLSCSS